MMKAPSNYERLFMVTIETVRIEDVRCYDSHLGIRTLSQMWAKLDRGWNSGVPVFRASVHDWKVWEATKMGELPWCKDPIQAYHNLLKLVKKHPQHFIDSELQRYR